MVIITYKCKICKQVIQRAYSEIPRDDSWLDFKCQRCNEEYHIPVEQYNLEMGE